MNDYYFYVNFKLVTKLTNMYSALNIRINKLYEHYIIFHWNSRMIIVCINI